MPSLQEVEIDITIKLLQRCSIFVKNLKQKKFKKIICSKVWVTFAYTVLFESTIICLNKTVCHPDFRSATLQIFQLFCQNDY